MDMEAFDRHADLHGYFIEDLSVGMRASYAKTITEADLRLAEAEIGSGFRACTRMARSDVCGDGTTFTHEGTSIENYDYRGVGAVPPEDWPEPSAWTATIGSSPVTTSQAPSSICAYRLHWVVTRCVRCDWHRAAIRTLDFGRLAPWRSTVW